MRSGGQHSVGDLLYLMIALSDNTATNLLIGLVGTRAVDDRMAAYGLPQTRLYRPTFRGGQADVFSARVQVGQRASAASISYLNRHLGDSDDSLNTRVYYDDYTRPGYRISSGGATSEIGRPFTNNWIGYMRGYVVGSQEGRAAREREIALTPGLLEAHIAAHARLEGRK
jgi:hypothetical protein